VTDNTELANTGTMTADTENYKAPGGSIGFKVPKML
jgi:hypothetical protein